MGYNRTKTCNYCGGNHSVMDCEKLQENDLKAQEVINKISNNDKAYLIEVFLKLVRYYAYDGTWDRTKKETIYKLNKRSCSEFAEEHRWYFSNYGDSMTRLLHSEEGEQLYNKCISTLKKEITDQEHDVFYSEKRSMMSERDAHRIIREATHAREAKAKRAKKSCSYCRSTDHTARTCPVKKNDMKMHYKAHKIACYLTARALARFGFWTGSMVMTQTGIKIWKSVQSTRLFHNAPIISGYDKLSEDEVDYVYLTEITDSKIYFNTPDQPDNRHRYGSSARLEIGRSPFGFKRIDWENNRLPVLEPNENDAYAYARVIGFYPTHIDLSHIYHRIVQNYIQPATTTRKYDSPTITIFDGNRFRRIMEEGDDFNFWSSGSDLFDKKQRVSGCWDKIKEFVELNQDILNKIEELTV